MKNKGEEFYIIDGSSYLYRGYYAIRSNLTTSTGFPTKAIFNVTNMVLKVLKEKDPAYVVVVWDAKGPNFRHALYPGYKANRPPMPEDLVAQIPYVKDIIEALGIAQLEAEGVEADDSIATLAKGIRGIRKVIVSGDKDLAQLVDDECVIWDPMKDEWIDRDEIERRFGIPPERLLDVQALSGDASDNIPGVKGIGPKKALKLIQDYGSLDGLLKRLDQLPKGKLKENLKAEQKNIDLYKTLVALKEDVPIDLDLELFRRKERDLKRLKRLFEELELRKFLNEFINTKKIEYDHYVLAVKPDTLSEIAQLAHNTKEMVIDTETDSETPVGAHLVGISIAINPPKAYYIPIAHQGFGQNVGIEALKDKLGPVLKDKGIKKVGQNIKYDLIVLSAHGLELKGIDGDTMIASYLLDPSRRAHGLDALSKEYLGHKTITYKEVVRGKKLKDFSQVEIHDAMKYACEDVHITWLLKDVLFERLKKAGLYDLFKDVEMPLVEVLAHMETTGVLLDQEGIRRLGQELESRISHLEEEIYRISGERFNINSPQQLQNILFEKLGLVSKKKTKKRLGLSTDMEVLNELAGQHPICGLIIEYRNLTKLKGTYIDGLFKVINPVTGRVHTSFNQTVTATGRLSSSNPNLQNIPVRGEDGLKIRALFVAAPGNVLLSADYSQIDLRVLAHYSQDDALVGAFKQGEDIHTKTASEIFDCHPAFVTPDMRRVAKTVNFGIIYGMSPYGLAKELGIERSKAKKFIDRYFERYPGVKRYMEWAIEEARHKGFVTTILGRRRFIPEIKSRVNHVRQFAERTAINTPIQGSAADIIKVAMLKVYEYIKKRGLHSKLILQVHDELVLEVPEQEVDQIVKDVKHIMEHIMTLKVPLVVNVATGKNWAEAKS